MVNTAHCVAVFHITLLCPIRNTKTSTLEICAVWCTWYLQCTHRKCALQWT